MKVFVQFSGAKNDPGNECQESCDIYVNGKIVAHAGNLSDCLEDAHLGRYLKFVYDLPTALRAAHDAGRRGEPFDLEEVEYRS